MTSLLLVVIYIAFISLGLPDTLLGSAWPSMYPGLGVPVSYAGIINMIISGGTIVSSLLTHRLVRRLGPGKVTVLSVAMTAAALMGFAFSPSFWLLCLWAIPYGLGAGSVDAVLNNYVALHYQSRHMSWLHCFWGVGATVGPYIMGLCLAGGLRWNSGYQTIGIMQLVLVAGLALSLPLWDAQKSQSSAGLPRQKALSLSEAIKLPGAKAAFTAFFAYCALEASTSLWAGSYMVLHRGIHPEQAAKWTSLFFLGVTFGRLVSGFVTERLGDRLMVRIGQGVAGAGALLLLLPMGDALLFTALMLIGLGCAPIYPSLLHQTPANFGEANSQAVMGVQMASAYVGTTLMPPLFGFIAQHLHIGLYPAFLLLFVLLCLIMTERVNRTDGKAGN